MVGTKEIKVQASVHSILLGKQWLPPFGIGIHPRQGHECNSLAQPQIPATIHHRPFAYHNLLLTSDQLL